MKKWIFEFEQETAVKNNLSLTDLFILSYLHNFFESGNAQSIIYETKEYYKITYNKLLNDLPILKIGGRQLSRMINNLKNKQVINCFYDAQKRLFININYEIIFDLIPIKGSTAKNSVGQKCHTEAGQYVKNVILPVGQKCHTIVKLTDSNKLKLKLNIISNMRARVKDKMLEQINKAFLIESKKHFSSVSYDLWIKDLIIEKITNKEVELQLKNEFQYSTLSGEFFTEKLTSIIKQVIEGFVDEKNHSVSSQDKRPAQTDSGTV